MSGGRLEVRVHIVTGAQSAAENIVKCVRRCGLEVEQLVLNPSASSLATLTPDEAGPGRGPGRYWGRNDRRRHLHRRLHPPHRCDPHRRRSDHLRHRHGLRTPTKDAEEIKVEHGVAKQLLAEPADQVEVPGLGDRSPGCCPARPWPA